MIYDSYHVLILVLVDFTLWQDSEELVNTMFIKVLILVLVDFTLWLMAHIQQSIVIGTVLILVLVDFTLWPINLKVMNKIKFVLILVLVDFTLWHNGFVASIIRSSSLNPCFSGLYSLTTAGTVVDIKIVWS